MISHKYKFIFFHIPKAAGSSIIGYFNKYHKNRVLMNNRNNELIQYLKYNETNTSYPNHIACQYMKEYFNEYIFNEYFKFSFVRNPFEKLVSLYFYTHQIEKKLIKKDPSILYGFNKTILESDSFENWIYKENLGQPQSDFLLDSNKDILVDFVGKTENLIKDFDYICKKLNIENKGLQHKNSSQHKGYREYFNKATRRIVEKHFEKDLELFDYSF